MPAESRRNEEPSTESRLSALEKTQSEITRTLVGTDLPPHGTGHKGLITRLSDLESAIVTLSKDTEKEMAQLKVIIEGMEDSFRQTASVAEDQKRYLRFMFWVGPIFFGSVIGFAQLMVSATLAR